MVKLMVSLEEGNKEMWWSRSLCLDLRRWNWKSGRMEVEYSNTLTLWGISSYSSHWNLLLFYSDNSNVGLNEAAYNNF